MGVFFCLPHVVVMNDCIICRELCALRCCKCEFWVLGKTKNIWVHSMGSAVLFILMSRLLFYSAGFGVRRVHVFFFLI